MYRKSFIKYYTDNNFSFDEAKSEVDFVLEMLFNFTSKDFFLGKSLEKWQIDKIEKIIKQRVNTRKPIQQIIGSAFFYGRRFFVNEYTLIPRPETEILVSEVLKILEDINNPKILDIGTGTGCIPITLEIENNNLNAHSVDVSKEAIEMAEKNALLHNVYEKIKFIESDLFSKIKEKYNVIVSNPPYIPIKEKDSLQYEVKNYDPSLALFAKDEDGIDYYKKIIADAHKYLLEDGFLCFEIGQNQGKLVTDLLKNNDYKNIKIIKDLNSLDRIVISQK